MATLPTDEESARHILSIYKYFNTRPNEMLMPRNFIAHWANSGLNTDDLENGLVYASEQGWIEPLDSGNYNLTDSGYAEL